MATKVKYYTDEHVAKAVVKGLRTRGVNVLTCQEAGMLEALDEEHLDLASRQGRVVFTQDDDFLKLHAKGIEHSGIVYSRQGTKIGDIVRGLMLVYQVLDAEDMVNHVEFI